MNRKHFLMLLAASTVALTAGTAQAGGTVTVKGSDTMVILGQRWAEAYMNANPGTTIQVTGGGSGTGISALINGTTDICASSRAIKQPEKEKLRERFSTTGTEIPVAKDGLSVYVHASNGVSELSLDQLKGIFTGKITDWSQVGGAAGKIVVYSRENSSGTYVFFKDAVLKGADYTPRAQTLPGTAAVVNAVARDAGSIGYGGAAYAKGIKILKIKKDAATPGVSPDAATVKAGTYPLARNLFFYTRNKPAGDIKAFIDWALGPAGQALVSKVGYFPVL